MVARPFCLCLCLLTFLGAGAGAPAGADPLPFSGEVRLALSPTAASYLPIDIGTLAERSCDLPLLYQPPDGMAKCYLVVRNPPGCGGATAGKLVGNGWPALVASTLEIESSEGVETSCGIWDFTLALAPGLPQPESPMVFEEAPEDPGRGVFAGVMEMSTILRLVNRDTGRSVEFPLRLGLGLAGPWVLVPPDDSHGDAPAPGELLLFAERREGKLVQSEDCIPFWIVGSPEDLADLVARGCRICWFPEKMQQNDHADDGLPYDGGLP